MIYILQSIINGHLMNIINHYQLFLKNNTVSFLLIKKPSVEKQFYQVHSFYQIWKNMTDDHQNPKQKTLELIFSDLHNFILSKQKKLPLSLLKKQLEIEIQLPFFYILKMSNFRFVLLWVMISLSSAQTPISNTTSPYNLTFFPQASLNLYNDPFYTATHAYRAFQISMNFIFTLGNNNIVQVYSRANPAVPLHNYTHFSVANTTDEMYCMAVDQTEKYLVLTSWTGSLVQQHINLIGADGSLTFWGVRGDSSVSKTPRKTIMKTNKTYTSFEGITQVYRTDIIANITTVVSVATSKPEMKVTPDRSRVIVWDYTNAEVFVYALDSNFSQLFNYTGSKTGSGDTPQYVNLNIDGSLFILQTNSKSPVRIINTSTGIVTVNITFSQKIHCANFIDSGNRFVFMQTDIGDIFYDTVTSSTVHYLMNDSLLYPNTQVDIATGLMYNINTTRTIVYGTNVTYNGTVMASYYFHSPPVSPTPAPDNSSSNSNDPSQNFYSQLNYTAIQNITLENIGKAIQTMDAVIQNTFSVLFSTPLATFFLSTLNYFTLMSLYVLLNIKIPYSVFLYFSQLYTSCQATILDQFGMILPVNNLTHERVTLERALYFKVSSDLLPAHGSSWCILLANIVLVETIILVTGKKWLNLDRIHRVVKKQRGAMYLGLVVSNMPPVILPWRDILSGGRNFNFATKVNLAAYYLLFGLFIIIVGGSFVNQVRDARTAKKKHFVKIAFRNWWVNYQNFIYPLLVLFDNPLYFLIPIAFSQCVYLFNSFGVPRFKILAIMKALYPILFHSCFFIFHFSKDNLVLTFTSVACLAVFLLGAFHHFVETIVKMIKSIYLLVKSICKNTMGSRGKVGQSKQDQKRDIIKYQKRDKIKDQKIDKIKDQKRDKKDQRRDKIKDLVEVIKRRKNAKRLAESALNDQINKIIINSNFKGKNNKSKQNKELKQNIPVKNPKTHTEKQKKEKKENNSIENKKNKNKTENLPIKAKNTLQQDSEVIVKTIFKQTPQQLVRTEVKRQIEEQMKIMQREAQQNKKLKKAKDAPRKDKLTVQQRPKVRWHDGQ